MVQGQATPLHPWRQAEAVQVAEQELPMVLYMIGQGVVEQVRMGSHLQGPLPPSPPPLPAPTCLSWAGWQQKGTIMSPALRSWMQCTRQTQAAWQR
jgi:hypothetical protein